MPNDNDETATRRRGDPIGVANLQETSKLSSSVAVLENNVTTLRRDFDRFEFTTDQHREQVRKDLDSTGKEVAVLRSEFTGMKASIKWALWFQAATFLAIVGAWATVYFRK